MAGSGGEAEVEVVPGCEPGMDGGVMTNELGWVNGWVGGDRPHAVPPACASAWFPAPASGTWEEEKEPAGSVEQMD